MWQHASFVATWSTCGIFVLYNFHCLVAKGFFPHFQTKNILFKSVYFFCAQQQQTMSTNNVDDFFAEMLQEEQSKVKKVHSILVKQEVQSKQRVSTKQVTPTSLPTTIQQQEQQPWNALPTEFLASPSELEKMLAQDLHMLDANTKREIRIAALKKIQTIIKQQPAQTLRLLFKPSLYQPLLKMLSDSVEYCRETSAAILLEYVLYFFVTIFCSIVNIIKKDAETSWSQVFPVIKARWLKKEHFVEPSEEVRLALLKLLSAYVKYCSHCIKEYPSYIEEMFNDVLYNAFADEFPEVKKVCFSTFVIQLGIGILHGGNVLPSATNSTQG